MQLVHDMRDDLRFRMPDRGPLDVLLERFQHGESAEAERAEADKPLIGGRTTEDTLWACTTCGACQEVCPVFIEHPRRSSRCGRTWCWRRRRSRPIWRARSPTSSATATRGASATTSGWTGPTGLDVPTLDDKPDAEYLLWVGCAGAFDDRIIKQTRALVEVLHDGGVDFAVLGHEEGCTGDPARRAGNEMLFQMQAQQNVETLNAKKVKKVVTSCPHCLHTLKHDYPQFGGNFEVVHHTQLIRELVAAGKIRSTATSWRRGDGNGSGRGGHVSRQLLPRPLERRVRRAARRARRAAAGRSRPGRAAAQPRARLLLRRRRRAHVHGGEDRHAREPQPHRRDPRSPAPRPSRSPARSATSCSPTASRTGTRASASRS